MIPFLNALIQSHGYIGVFLFMSFFAAEIVMPVSGFLVRTNRLDLFTVIAAGTAGAMLGTIFIYGIARLVRPEQVHELARRYGRWFGISARSTARAERWFDRHARSSVCFGRFVPGIRSATVFVAGYRRMEPGWFLLCTVLPTALSTAVLAVAGYAVGNGYRDLQTALSGVSRVIVLVLVAGLIAWFAWRRYQVVRHDKQS